MTRLYLSYGSNLNKQAMRRRCPYARSVGRVLLPNARLVFRGVADVEFHEGSAVPCGLWDITPDCERSLDVYEGVKHKLYYKNRSIVLKWRDEPHHALIYLMRSEGVYPPSQAYVDVIRQGYKDFRLDESYLDEAIERSFDKAPDEQTTARRRRQLASDTQRALVETPQSVLLKRIANRA